MFHITPIVALIILGCIYGKEITEFTVHMITSPKFWKWTTFIVILIILPALEILSHLNR